MDIYKTVPGHEDYEVSDTGVVRSTKFNKKKILRTSDDGKGYIKVTLFNDGKPKVYRVHQLVAMAFLGHKPNGFDTAVVHIDGDRSNNTLKNIEVLTTREKCSRSPKGSNPHVGIYWAKGSKKWVAQIRIGKSLKHLGVFSDELKAAQAYQEASVVRNSRTAITPQ